MTVTTFALAQNWTRHPEQSEGSRTLLKGFSMDICEILRFAQNDGTIRVAVAALLFFTGVESVCHYAASGV
jgi:hypothetical protein